MSALLVLSGTLPDAERLVALCAASDTVVATDGAAVAMTAAGARVDIVIGDLDSIGPHRSSVEAAGATIVEEPSQDHGDFDKALVWLRENGTTSVTIVGFDGGMLDHTLNNASVLARHAHLLEINVISGNALARCVVDQWRIPANPGDRISLIPLPQARVTTERLEWPLRDEVLAFGAREGASNRASGADPDVIVHEGVVLVVHFPNES